MFRKFLDFFLPPHCFHCRTHIKEGHLFCAACAPFFELIDPSQRCPYCFISTGGKVCHPCRKKVGALPCAAALESAAPVLTFLKEIEKGNSLAFLKSAIAFLLIQFEKMRWPLPDAIIPLPPRTLLGHHVTKNLAAGLGKALAIPSILSLRRNFMSKEKIALRKKDLIYKTLLLLDLVHDQKRLFQSQKLLEKRFPKKIYSLTLIT